VVRIPKKLPLLFATLVLPLTLVSCSSSAATPTTAPATPMAAPATAAPSAGMSAAASPTTPVVATPSGLPNPCVNQSGQLPAQKTRIDIAVTFDVFDASRSTQFQAMESVASQINATCPNLQVVVTPYDSQSSVSKQISDIQTITLKKPQVLAVIPVDPAGIEPAVKAAHDAGIKIIDFRGSMLDAYGKELPFIDASMHGSDNPSYAAATVKWINDWLTANPTKNLNIGVIYGVASSTPNLIRGDAIVQLAKDNPTRVKIDATAYGNWLANLGQSYTQTWLLKYPDMNMVCAANDIMASGVAAAVEAAGKQNQVLVTGYDLTDAGIQRVQAGDQAVDVGVLPYDYANVIYEAIGLVNGTFPEGSDFTNENLYSVTSANVTQFLQTRKNLMGY
jgi:ABC-type sugar transport system substrate-binding protein